MLRLRRIGEVIWELDRDYRPDMQVPLRIIADDELLSQIVRDRSVEQLVNVSTLPGVTQFAVAMPDMHEGYGFPVGGVAATLAPEGVISPGGIGFDINCGVRLLASSFRADALGDVTPLVHELSRSIPTGFGRHGRYALGADEMERVMEEGAPWLVRERGFGLPEDLAVTESGGVLPGADGAAISERAKERGHDQLGTLGGGNHFLEVQRVDEILDSRAAGALGIFAGQLTVLVHTGSRGLGHQVCTDYVRAMDAALARHRIALPDRQLACAPLSSPEGRAYLAAMAAAANFAWCNRQMLTHRIREVFARVLGSRIDAQLRVVSDVAHNIAKM